MEHLCGLGYTPEKGLHFSVGEEKDKEAYLLYQISPETHDGCTGRMADCIRMKKSPDIDSNHPHCGSTRPTLLTRPTLTCHSSSISSRIIYGSH